MIAIDLSKQPELDADPKAIQQINFTRNLANGNNTSDIIVNITLLMKIREIVSLE